MSDAYEYWAFRFCIEGERGTLVHRSKAEELLDVIIGWAETEGLQVGGGYRAPREEDKTAPLYGQEGYHDF